MAPECPSCLGGPVLPDEPHTCPRVTRGGSVGLGRSAGPRHTRAYQPGFALERKAGSVGGWEHFLRKHVMEALPS